jgi:hypothetical protein
MAILAAFVFAAARTGLPLDSRAAILFATSFALELVDSSLGMGYGTTLTAILLLFGIPPLELVPAVLVSQFLCGFSAGFFHAESGNVRLDRGGPHLRAILLLSSFSLVGSVAGVVAAFSLSSTALTAAIGSIILASGALILIGRRRGFLYRGWKIGALALVASFNKSLSGGGYGPIMTGGQILSGIEARAAVGITSFAEGFTCLVGTVMFLVEGRGWNRELLLPVVAGAMLSVPISARLVRRVREAWMKQVIAWATMTMGVVILARLLWR